MLQCAGVEGKGDGEWQEHMDYCKAGSEMTGELVHGREKKNVEQT